jgi:hypothetical protein
MKSNALLFVSSEFPANSSTPPLLMEIVVEELLAFLSMLVFASGATIVVPSPRGLSGVPSVTESIRTPVFAGSFLRPILLLFEIVSEEVLSHVSVAVRALLHHR